jgi:hypothetical protein
MATQGTAVLVSNRLSGFRRHAALYRVTPPMQGHQFVVVAWAHEMSTGPKTNVFGADANGKVVDWTPLPGSMSGDHNHTEVLAKAGYTLQPAGSQP